MTFGRGNPNYSWHLGSLKCDSLRFLAIWIPRNVTILGFIRNLLRFLGINQTLPFQIPRNPMRFPMKPNIRIATFLGI